MSCPNAVKTFCVLCCALFIACQTSTAPAPAAIEAPPGSDTAAPFPIDRGDDGAQTPGTYKGLWLRLADNGSPTVTPLDGVIGVVCVGMSNSNQECGEYITRLGTEYAAQVSASVRVVNCAVGGHAIERCTDEQRQDRADNPEGSHGASCVIEVDRVVVTGHQDTTRPPMLWRVRVRSWPESADYVRYQI